MAFWKVAGFSQPSPIEVGMPAAKRCLICSGTCLPGRQHSAVPCSFLQQILDKEEYTLEELLDEDNMSQECKSLNGRLIAL